MEDIMNWAIYFKNWQAVLKEFDVVAVFNKDLLIWYFWYELKFSICIHLYNQDRDLKNWQEIIEKAIDTKAKAR